MNYKSGFISFQIIVSLCTFAGFLLEDNLSNYFLLFLTIIGWGFLSMAYSTDSNYDLPRMVKDPTDIRIYGYKKSKDKMKGCYNCSYSRDIENNTYVYCWKHERKVFRHNECRDYKI